MKVRCLRLESQGDNLTIGKEYIVHGIKATGGRFAYLMFDDTQSHHGIFWFASSIFEIVDGKVSSDWYFAIYDQRFESKRYLYTLDSYSIWAPKELALNPDSLIGLIERDPAIVAAFLPLIQMP